MLYQTALHKFYEKRAAYGEDKMQAKLLELRTKRQDLLHKCVVDNRPFPASELKDKFHSIVNPPGIIIGGWKLKDENDLQWFSFLGVILPLPSTFFHLFIAHIISNILYLTYPTHSLITLPSLPLTCDIFASHAAYNFTAFQQILPRNQTFYVTILRNTTATYNSMFKYFFLSNPITFNNGKGSEFNPSTQSFNQYLLKLPELFLNLYAHRANYVKFLRLKYANDTQKLVQKVLDYRYHMALTRNTAMYDFGYRDLAHNPIYHHDRVRLQEIVKEIIDRFDLILINERFDEGLVLLADKLCWKLEDMISFSQNVNIQPQNFTVGDLDSRGVANLEDMMDGDNLLYQTVYGNFGYFWF